MPPFFAPGTSGAGPLAFGSRAAPAWSTGAFPPLVPLPAPPLLAAGAPQAATKPREAAAPTVRTLVQRICCCSLVLVPAFCREHLVTATRWGQRRLVGSNASRIESPSRLRASTSSDRPMTEGQSHSGYVAKRFCASAMVRPQEAVGSTRPAPR